MTSILAMQLDTLEADWILRWQTNPPAVLAGAIIANVRQEIGDARIWCADGSVLVVERKTPSDFLSSIPNDHIFDQAARMMIDRRDTGSIPYLVITGEVLRNPKDGTCVIPGSPHGAGWSWRSVQGALLTIQLAGVPVVYCAGDNDYATCLDWLASRNHGDIVINPGIEIGAITPQEKVLCSFDGIGPTLAGEILKRCGYLSTAIDYLCDLDPDAPKIPGIGMGRKQAIRKTLQLADGNTLAERAV
jgi:ERCC4-type nuclease